MRRSLPSFAVLVVSLCLLPSIAAADSILLAPYTSATYSFAASYGAVRALSETNSNKPARGRAAISKTTKGSYQSDTFEFSADAQAGFLDFGVGTSLTYDVDGTPTRYFDRADAASLTFFRYDFAPWNGLPGVATFSFSVDGTIDGNASTASSGLFIDSGAATPVNETDPFGLWSIDFISGNNCVLCQIWTWDQTTSTAIDVDIPFVYGQWTALSVGFISVISTAPRGQGTATVDFFHTLALQGVVAKDANGITAPDASVEFVSTVPEPGSVVLVGIGLSLAALRRRKT